MIEFKKHVWAEIDLDAIKANADSFKTLTNSEIIAVVKANAYGHGALKTAMLLSEIGINSFAVASVREAAELREGGIQGKILVLGHTAPQDAEALLELSASQTVYSKKYAKELAETLKNKQKKLNIHIKLNTGMNRLGFRCRDTEESLAEIIDVLKMDCFCFEGIFTHFASADGTGDDNLHFTKLQADKFMTICESLSAAGYTPKTRHCCNTAGIITMPDMHLDAVRLGISLYGLTPDINLKLPINLHPAMTLKSTVAMVHQVDAGETISYGRTFKAEKETRLATIAIGYADGYPRHLSSKGSVLIGGSRCKILGKICMDQMIVDVTHLDNVCEGDEVVLIGRQGEEFISTEEIATLSDTINYEIICGISRRVPRYYFKDGKLVSVTDYVLKSNY